MSKERAARVVTSLKRVVEGAPAGQPEEVFLLHSMVGRERLGEPYVYDLELLAEEHDVELEPLLGTRMHVELRAVDDELRYFHGHVTEISRAGARGRYALYRVRLEPWIKLLDYNVDCRIYQEKSSPEVVQALIDEVFDGRARPDVQARLTEAHASHDYVVQYRETDLAFLSRMLEAAGIYYFFDHGTAGADLVLCDGSGPHRQVAPVRELPYLTSGGGGVTNDAHLANWQRTHRVRPGVASARAYDFERPDVDLTATQTSEDLEAGREHQVFLYAGKCSSQSQADALVLRMNRRDEAHRDTTRVETNDRHLATGHAFAMNDHPLDSERGEYLVVASEFRIQLDDYEGNHPTFGGDVYGARLEVAPLARPYLPELATPRPSIRGPQTATVVGPAKDEIHTDEHGRVKLRFHWDPSPTRDAQFYEPADEKRTCWVRVAQGWASSGFGMQFIPRVGDEVVVAFLEGDPDRPLVVGSVYNGANQHPYAPDKRPTRSGIKTHSSPGGGVGDGNEIRFEDKKGSEDLYLQAQRTQTTLVKGDQSVTVGGKRTVTVAKANHDTIRGGHVGDYENGRHIHVFGADDHLKTDLNRIVDVETHYRTTSGQSHVAKQGDNQFSMQGGQVTLTNGTSTLKLHGSKAEVDNGKCRLTLNGLKAEVDNGKCRLALDGDKATLEGEMTVTIKAGNSTLVLGKDGITVTGLPINLN